MRTTVAKPDRDSKNLEFMLVVEVLISDYVDFVRYVESEYFLG